MIHIAVLGYGTVGSGVVEVIETNKKLINERIADEINVKYILDLRDFPNDPYEKKVIHDYEQIVADPEVSIVAEVMGGITAAYDFTKRALLAGKSVATSNKALVAKHGAELFAVAKENNVNYLFGASVGGGIPIIRPINCCLTADEIDEVSGILNGTTNYILSKMFFEGADYAGALKEAQALGYAESNPEADVEGYDACRKIAILTSLINGHFANYENVYTEGITKISADDMKYIKAMGKTVKLLATSRKQDGRQYVYVCPVILSPEHPLFNVNDVFNAVFVHGNMLGDAMFYGSGAGKLPTASAVAADIIDAINTQGHNNYGWDGEDLELADISGLKRAFFVRVKGDGSSAEQAFGNISRIDAGIPGECGFVTEVMSEREFEEKLKKTDGFISRIRLM